MSPRWRHFCPKCHRTIYWRQVYCRSCIKENPRLESFYIRPAQRRLRGKRLTGVLPTRARCLAALNGSVLCVECGGRLRAGKRAELRHRCYPSNDRHLHNRQHLYCVLCKRTRAQQHFPIIDHERLSVRAAACNECLVGATMLVVNRPYAVKNV